MKPIIRQMICTDVVVLGSGAAGLRAAIEARRHGVEVVIVSASGIGHANNSSISHGGFSTSMVQDGDSAERFIEDTIRGGNKLNSRSLVRMLSYNISAEVCALEKMGVTFRRVPEGSYALEGRGGHSVARRLSTIHSSGMELLLPLMRTIKQSKIRVLEGVKGVLLLKRGGFVYGVVGVSRKGEWVCVGGKTVILATGGGAALYPKTTNVPWANGSGYALAYEAGLMVQDMEFVQFVLRHVNHPGIPARIPPIEVFLLSGADLLNSSGQSILRCINSFTRDAIARAVARAIEEERRENGGFVYLDLKKCRSTEGHSFSNFATSTVRVVPAAHFFMGGVRVRNNLSTSIEGLYVAGETMGGVHGANRLGGNALAEAFVFGAKAGELAAIFAKKCAANFEFLPLDYAAGELERQGAIFSGERSKLETVREISKLKKDLRTILGIHAGVLRSKSKLSSGLSALETLKFAFCQLSPPAPQELWDWFDFSHSITVAQIIFRSCLEREETRGAHYRQDFPQMDDENWLVNICINKSSQGKMTISRSTVP